MKDGYQELEKYTAEELEKSFIRSTCEGYSDVTINGKKQNNFHALINANQAKEWFQWLAKIPVYKQSTTPEFPSSSSAEQRTFSLKEALQIWHDGLATGEQQLGLQRNIEEQDEFFKRTFGIEL